MRFVATITHAATILARVSIDDTLAETLSQHALRARDTLVRDANRHRSVRLSDEVLDEFAEIYAHVVVSQTLSRQSRTVTCVSRNGAVSKLEGQIALLTGPSDLIMLIEAHDDAWIAEREHFTNEILRTA